MAGVEVKGLVSTKRKLSKLMPEVAKEVDQKVLKRRATLIWREAKTYEPPALPTYKRTGNMSRQTILSREGTQSWKIEMRAPSSKWVRGDAAGKFQRRHPSFSRWRKFKNIRDGGVKGIVAEVESTIEKVKRRLGLK